MTREELLKYRLDGSKSFPFHIKEQEIQTNMEYILLEYLNTKG